MIVVDCCRFMSLVGMLRTCWTPSTSLLSLVVIVRDLWKQMLAQLELLCLEILKSLFAESIANSKKAMLRLFVFDF